MIILYRYCQTFGHPPDDGSATLKLILPVGSRLESVLSVGQILSCRDIKEIHFLKLNIKSKHINICKPIPTAVEMRRRWTEEQKSHPSGLDCRRQ